MLRSRAAVEIRNLKAQVDRLAQKIEDLDREVDALRTEVGEPGDVLVIEQMSREQVRARVLEVLATGATTDVAQLHETIRCDIGVLLDVLDELRQAGQLIEG